MKTIPVCLAALVLSFAPSYAGFVISETFDTRALGNLPIDSYPAAGVYSGGGTAVTPPDPLPTVAGAIVQITGSNRGLSLTGNYSAINSNSTYWGCYVSSPSFIASGSVATYAGYEYEFVVSGTESGQFDVRFFSADSGNLQTSALTRTFNYTGIAGAAQTFRGNLGEGGWAPIDGISDGTPLKLTADRYQFLFQQTASTTSWGRDAANTLTLESISLATSGPPEPPESSIVAVIDETFDTLNVASLPNSGYPASGQYSQSGTATTSGSIVQIALGNLGLSINGNYSLVALASTNWGGEIVSPSFGLAGSVASLSAYRFSFTVIGNQPGRFDVRFYDTNKTTGVIRGGIGKNFNYTGTNTPQTFSGNLGEAGWESPSFVANGVPIKLTAPQYSFSFQQTGDSTPPISWGRDANNIITLDKIKLSVSGPPEPPPRSPLFPVSGTYTNDFSATLGKEWSLTGWVTGSVFSGGYATMKGLRTPAEGFGNGGEILQWPYNNLPPFTPVFPLPPLLASKSFVGAGFNTNRFGNKWLVNEASSDHSAKATLTLRGLPTHSSISIGCLAGIGGTIDANDRNPGNAPNNAFQIQINNGVDAVTSLINANDGNDLSALSSSSVYEIFKNANASLAYREEWTPAPISIADRIFLTYTTSFAYNLGAISSLNSIIHSASTLNLEFLHALDSNPDDEFVALDNLSITLNDVTPGTNAGQWAASYLDDVQQAALSGDAAWNLDPDGDGISNLLEYAFNSNPLVPSPATLLPTLSIVEVSGQPYLAISYRSPKGVLERNDLARKVESSSNLSAPNTWTRVEVVPFGSPVDNGDGTETVTLRDTQSAPVAGQPRRFLRLNFSLSL